MRIQRREFIGTAAAAGMGAFSAGHAAAFSASTAQSNGTPDAPTRQAVVERLFKSPDLHPNALEASPEGLWIGDQVSEKVHQVDWATGKTLQEIQTAGHNTSGLAVGAGYLWVGSNGGVSGRRPPRPQDVPYGEITQADLSTGKTVKAWRLKWPGGIHGVTFVPQTQTLWVTALSLTAIAELDVQNDMRILRMFPAPYPRAHGLDWDNGAMWVLYAGQRKVRKFEPNSGELLETMEISPTSDPDPHGMCIHDGYMYYCDAGLTAPGPASAAGLICRIKIT